MFERVIATIASNPDSLYCGAESQFQHLDEKVGVKWTNRSFQPFKRAMATMLRQHYLSLHNLAPKVLGFGKVVDTRKNQNHWGHLTEVAAQPWYKTKKMIRGDMRSTDETVWKEYERSEMYSEFCGKCRRYGMDDDISLRNVGILNINGVETMVLIDTGECSSVTYAEKQTLSLIRKTLEHTPQPRNVRNVTVAA